MHPFPALTEDRVWISLINMHASVRMVTKGKCVRLILMSATTPLLMSPCVSMELRALTVRDQTLHAGEEVHNLYYNAWI